MDDGPTCGRMVSHSKSEGIEWSISTARQHALWRDSDVVELTIVSRTKALKADRLISRSFEINTIALHIPGHYSEVVR